MQRQAGGLNSSPSEKTTGCGKFPAAGRFIRIDFRQRQERSGLCRVPRLVSRKIPVSYTHLDVYKRQGLVVHADETEKVNTLVHHIQAYLYQKEEWDPAAENSFAPALCNRIDRNTGGIVIAAKNAETLRVINEKIRTHELRKAYLCVAVGRPRPAAGKIEGFLLKDEEKKQVAFYQMCIRDSGRTSRLPAEDSRFPPWKRGFGASGPLKVRTLPKKVHPVSPAFYNR